jgi:hypothetical protein
MSAIAKDTSLSLDNNELEDATKLSSKVITDRHPYPFGTGLIRDK